MPLSGPSSYVETIEEFTAHWFLVDTDLGAGNEMTLVTGPADAVVTVPRADLVALRDELDAAQDSVQAALNQVEITRGTVMLGKTTLLAQAQAYGRKVRGLFPPGSPFLSMTPELPGISAGQETFLRPMRDISNAWSTIDEQASGFTLPPAGTTLAQFIAAVGALETSWKDLNAREVELGYQREKRNSLQEEAAAILGRYRPTVESQFAPDSPLVASIPRLRPLPGHTPDAVSLSAEWDVAETKARLTWTASTEATLASYQIRMSPSETYDADAESTIATIPAAGALGAADHRGPAHSRLHRQLQGLRGAEYGERARKQPGDGDQAVGRVAPSADAPTLP